MKKILLILAWVFFTLPLLGLWMIFGLGIFAAILGIFKSQYWISLFLVGVYVAMVLYCSKELIIIRNQRVAYCKKGLAIS